MLELIKESPYQVGVVLLSIWCSVLTAAFFLLARVLWTRITAFPAVTISAVLKGWAEHEKTSAAHVGQIKANTKELERLVPEMRQHGDLGRRMDSLEGEFRGLKKTVESDGKENREQHRDLAEGLQEIASGLAGVQGYMSGKANGRVKT